MRFPQSLLTNPFALLAMILALTIVSGTLVVGYLEHGPFVQLMHETVARDVATATPVSDGLQSLVRDNVRPNDWYGAAVALDDFAAFISSPRQAVDGRRTGAVHLFEREPRGNWRAAHEFTRPELADGGMFGVSLAADAGRVLIGVCPNELQTADSPVAFLYEREDNDWRAVPLTMGDEEATSMKSVALALDGDTAIVSQIARDAVTDRPSNRTCVFRSNPNGAWQRIATLAADEPTAPPRSNFGAAVALSGKQAIVGAPLQTTDNGTTGAAYIYEEQADGQWRRTSLLVADDSQAADCFGASVAISGDTALVGAMASNATGGMNSGAAYVFRKSATGNWNQVVKLAPPDLKNWSCFGTTVALDGDLAVVTAPGTSDGMGTVHVFRLDETGAAPLARFRPASTTPRAGFGQSVSIDAGSLLAGAPWEDTPTQDNTGAAYTLELELPRQVTPRRVRHPSPIFARH